MVRVISLRCSDYLCEISQELLYLESLNLVHMTSMTSCVVGQKIGAVGPGPL